MSRPERTAHASHAAALAIFDLDGTITRRDTLLPYITGYLARHPRRWWRVPLCLAPLLRYCLPGRDRGALKGAVIRLTLGGVTRRELVDWNRRFVARLLRGGVFAEALERIGAHRTNGAYLVLLSASPDLYVPEIAAALNFDTCVCTELYWQPDGRLRGTLASLNRRAEEKVRCVQTLLSTHRPFHSYAYGNSSADLPHLRLVSDGYYVNGRSLPAPDRARIRTLHWQTPGLALPRAEDHNQP